MSRYYDIVSLKIGDGIELNDKSVTIDLDKVTPKDIIHNDDAFNESLQPDRYIYVSGGGSYLFDNRYLLVVRRPLTARVNPGKFSIFTGRADGYLEWQEPWRVVRELFEEVVLFKGNMIFYPYFPAYQEIIDEVYQKNFNDKYAESYLYTKLDLTSILPDENILKVISNGVSSEHRLSMHINSKNDINILSLFSVDLNPNDIQALDTEEMNSSRKIYLFDIETTQTRRVGLGDDEQWKPLSKENMTEHLLGMLDLIKKNTRCDS
jgi:hypothetical protein